MPPPKKFNGSVILYDASLGGELAAEARSCVSTICAHKFFMNYPDVTHVVIFNCSRTNNALVGQFGRPDLFRNIDVVTYDSAVKFEPNFILGTIDAAQCAVGGNWFEALLLALELTKEFYKTPGNEYNQIICLTDLVTSVPKVTKKLKQQFKRVCKLTRCSVVVGGPQCKFPPRLKSPYSLKKWRRTLELADYNPNYVIAKELSQISNTFFCNFKMAHHLFLGLRGHQMQPWNVPLTVGTKLKFCVQTYRILQKCKLKMRENTDQVIEEKWVLAEDGTVTVPFDNVISGVLLHGKYVPLPQEVRQSFKLIGNACCKVLCFVKRNSLPDAILGSDATYLTESHLKASKSNRRLLCALHLVLKKSRMCMISRRVYIKNCAPTLLVHIPIGKKGMFVVHKLPFRHDIPFPHYLLSSYFNKDLNGATRPAVPEETDNLISDYLGDLDITDKNCVLKTFNGGSAFPVLSASCALSYTLQAVCQGALQAYMSSTSSKIPVGCCDPMREFRNPVCEIPPALEDLFETIS